VYEFIIRPEAEQDLAEAFAWYEEKRQGLGHDFLLHVHAGFRFLERDPLVFSGQYKEVRCYLIRRSPYKIFYRVEAQPDGFKLPLYQEVHRPYHYHLWGDKGVC
jgi:hypothetical protein